MGRRRGLTGGLASAAAEAGKRVHPAREAAGFMDPVLRYVEIRIRAAAEGEIELLG